MHVLRNAEGGWRVQLEDNEQPWSEHRSQLEAIAEGRRLARAEKSKLLIHAKDGWVRDRMAYDGVVRSHTRW